MPGGNIYEQRLAFGTVAELYDRARPSYPATTIDTLCELARLGPDSEVLEVGAGTGKATRLLADRGMSVTALEPDAAMAAIARRNSEYCELIETHQDHILLAPIDKAHLLSAVSQAVEVAGGIDIDFVTRLCLARRA